MIVFAVIVEVRQASVNAMTKFLLFEIVGVDVSVEPLK